jgi:hypothetical protein
LGSRYEFDPAQGLPGQSLCWMVVGADHVAEPDSYVANRGARSTWQRRRRVSEKIQNLLCTARPGRTEETGRTKDWFVEFLPKNAVDQSTSDTYQNFSIRLYGGKRHATCR